MPAADDAPDGRHRDPADQLRHDLLTPATVASAFLGMLARVLWRSAALGGPERERMLANAAAAQVALLALVAVVDGLGEGRGGGGAARGS